MKLSLFDSFSYSRTTFGERVVDGVLYCLRNALGKRTISINHDQLLEEKMHNVLVRCFLLIVALATLPIALLALAAKKIKYFKKLNELFGWYQIGQETRQYILSLKIVSPNNFEESYLRAHNRHPSPEERAEVDAKLTNLRKYPTPPPRTYEEKCARLKLVAEKAQRLQVGNCGELSAIAYLYIQQKFSNTQVGLFKLKAKDPAATTADHCFTLIGTKHSRTRVLYDPWSDKLFITTEINKLLKNYLGLDASLNPHLQSFKADALILEAIME